MYPRKPSLLSSFLLLVTTKRQCVVPVAAAASSSCSVCGPLGPASLPWKDKPMPDIDIPISTCADLEASTLLVEPGSEFCPFIQAFSTHYKGHKFTQEVTL
mmetsp:Transcript_18844/g.32241  ORF Transcript_18844/g.32241 Transcript_18844/m.32241 type:complete len:101 (+) Transcript_18844:1793-2095(+)